MFLGIVLEGKIVEERERKGSEHMLFRSSTLHTAVAIGG